MRLSIDKSDPGFSHRAVGLRANIFLDEQPAKDVITADEDQGLIVRYRRSEDGQVMIDEEAKSFVVETVRGKVRIDLLADDGTSLREPKVAVERNLRTGEVEVYVYSRLRPKVSKMAKIAPAKQSAIPKRLAVQVGLIAMALADQVMADFGDFYSAPEVAEVADEAARRMLEAEEKLSFQRVWLN